jgi:nucleoside-diphosphate-sugar epimerase
MQVIFGAGALGQAVMRECLRRGEQVRIINRSSKPALPAEVEWIQGDARNGQFCSEVCKGASVVYNCTGLPYEKWSAELPAIQRGIIEGAASSGAKLIYADNLYAYGPCPGTFHEDLPYQPAGAKTAVRGQLAQMVLQAHKEGKILAAIGRGADFYGPHARVAVLGERVFQPALSGRAAEVIGDIDQPHTHIYIDDFAWGLVTLSEHEAALGQVWHIPAAETVTTRQLIEMIYRQAGHQPKYRIANGFLLTVMGWFVPPMREFKEMMYMFNRPFVVEHEKFRKAFGMRVTPHEEAIQRTLEWYKSVNHNR